MFEVGDFFWGRLTDPFDASGSFRTELFTLKLLGSLRSSLDLYLVRFVEAFDFALFSESPSALSSSNSSRLDDFLSMIGKVLKDFSPLRVIVLLCRLLLTMPGAAVLGRDCRLCSLVTATDVGRMLGLDLKAPLISFFELDLLSSFAEWMVDVTLIKVPLTYFEVP